MTWLKEFSIFSVALRLALAMAAGGVIGYGRSRKSRAAGFRTYMLISIGAALTVLMGLYEAEMFRGMWAPVVSAVGSKLDVSRYAAQVMSGLGFLGAGTILKDSNQQVSGLTTAIGLFASAAMGMAAGAGIYVGVIFVLVMIIVSIDMLYDVEKGFKRHMRQFTVHVEFEAMEDIDAVAEVLRSAEAQVFEIDVEHTKKKDDSWPAAIFNVKLAKKRASHSEMLTSIAELPCVHAVQELIS